MSEDTRKKLSLKRDSAEPTKVEERLHKVLAQAGLGSRRALEERIAAGLVQVNGETAQTGQSVKNGDRIELDGKVFVATVLTEPTSVLIYNKPEGVVTTREDPEGRPTVFEALPRLKGARWIAVGRLDINTTGLLLLTTDGELANALMHPSSQIEREYVCRIHGEVPDNIVDRLARGVALDDGPAKFDKIERIGSSDSHSWFNVSLSEGRNREVRRLWESQGYQVSRLKRVRYGEVFLPRELLRGRCVEMDAEAVEKLRKSVGVEDSAPVLTLQPVIGQRKARGAEVIKVGKDRRQNSYVNGAVNEEARELRRFDTLREDKSARRGPGRGKPGGKFAGAKRAPFRGPMDHGNDPNAPQGARPGKPGFAKPSGPRPARGPGGPARGPKREFRGPMDSNSSDFGNAAPFDNRRSGPGGPRPGGKPGGFAKPGGFKPGGPRPAWNNDDSRGNRAGDGGRPNDGNRPPRGPRGPKPGGASPSGEFRSWYVPEGVDTGAPRRGPRNDGGGFKGPRGNGPADGNRGPRGGGPADGNRGPRPTGGPRQGQPPGQNRGPRSEGGGFDNRGPRQPGPRPGGFKKPRRDGFPSDD